MKMPGFTADASLYKTTGRWQSANRQPYTSGPQRSFFSAFLEPFSYFDGSRFIWWPLLQTTL